MLSKLSIGLLVLASLFGLSKPANAEGRWGWYGGPGYAPYYPPLRSVLFAPLCSVQPLSGLPVWLRLPVQSILLAGIWFRLRLWAPSVIRWGPLPVLGAGLASTLVAFGEFLEVVEVSDGHRIFEHPFLGCRK